MVSRTFPGIAPIVIGTRTNDARLDKFGNQQGYTGGFQQLSPAAATNLVGARLLNPALSGKKLYVVGIYLSSTVAQRVDVDTPVTPARTDLGGNQTNPHFAGQAAGVGKTNVSNASGIPAPTNPNPSFQVGVNNPIYQALDHVLPQNSSLDFVFTNGVTTDKDTGFLEWYEE